MAAAAFRQPRADPPDGLPPQAAFDPDAKLGVVVAQLPAGSTAVAGGPLPPAAISVDNVAALPLFRTVRAGQRTAHACRHAFGHLDTFSGICTTHEVLSAVCIKIRSRLVAGGGGLAVGWEIDSGRDGGVPPSTPSQVSPAHTQHQAGMLMRGGVRGGSGQVTSASAPLLQRGRMTMTIRAVCFFKRGWHVDAASAGEGSGCRGPTFEPATYSPVFTGLAPPAFGATRLVRALRTPGWSSRFQQ